MKGITIAVMKRSSNSSRAGPDRANALYNRPRTRCPSLIGRQIGNAKSRAVARLANAVHFYGLRPSAVTCGTVFSIHFSRTSAAKASDVLRLPYKAGANADGAITSRHRCCILLRRVDRYNPRRTPPRLPDRGGLPRRFRKIRGLRSEEMGKITRRTAGKNSTCRLRHTMAAFELVIDIRTLIRYTGSTLHSSAPLIGKSARSHRRLRP